MNHKTRIAMKKTYIAPTITVMDINKEMPVLCISGHDKQPQKDNNGNLFSTERGCWTEDIWSAPDGGGQN